MWPVQGLQASGHGVTCGSLILRPCLPQQSESPYSAWVWQQPRTPVSPSGCLWGTAASTPS